MADKSIVKAEASSKKMLAFQLKELGLDKDSAANRVDAKKRKWSNTVSGPTRGSSLGGSGGGGGGGSGYIPPPPSGGPSGNDGMDDMDQPPPPDFDDGENMPVPPVPPPID
jgi:hypothetical protein